MPGQDLLDVGCGPGTLTLDLARRVAPGRVVGIDAASEAIVEAEALRRSDPSGNDVSFVQGDVYALQFPVDSFDVVHAHQLLQHLKDPVAALTEMRRVLRPGGTLAVRDADYAGFIWSPADPQLERWNHLYHELTARNGVEADAGRHLLGWVQAAGFSDARASSSTWTFADPENRSWWGGLWADRVLLSEYGKQALAYGLSDTAELASLAAAWRRWATAPDGFFAVVNVEVVARK